MAAAAAMLAALGLAAVPPGADQGGAASSPWRGNVGAALSATSGNTVSQSFQLTADATRLTPEDKLTLGGSANYARGRVDGGRSTTANKWALLGQYDNNLSAQVFSFVKLGLEADRLIHLDLRRAYAVGIGHKLLRSERHSLDLFGGLGYTSDRYRVVQTIDGVQGTHFARASVTLGEESAHRWSPTVQLKQRLEVLPALGGDKALLLKFKATLTVAMSRTLSLSVGIEDSYNSKPPAGTRSNDAGLFTGLNAKFGGS